MQRLKEEQEKETRLYGLNVQRRNPYAKDYKEILDKMWNL